MLEKLQKLWDSFQWCLSYIDRNGNQIDLELEILDTKTNILCIMRWQELVYVTNENITIINK